MGGGRKLGVALGAVAALWAATAAASGPGEPAPWYVDPYGGDRPDLLSFYQGRVGVVMANAPRSMLFMSWRLLHGRKVGQAAGEALSVPCCGRGGLDTYDAVQAWLKARTDAVPGASPIERLEAGRETEDYMEIANCFPEAFALASETLADRARRYGADSKPVRALLEAQDAVFSACSADDVRLPPPLAGAPAWLSQDRAYQEAALALYAGRNGEAADRFDAISKQRGSPWAERGTYLAARALVRQARQEKTPAAYARAEAAVDRLAKTRPGTFGRDEARKLKNAIAYRARPDAYLAELTARLERAEIGPEAAVDFRDLAMLGPSRPTPPDAVDWILTLKAQLDPPKDDAPEPDAQAARRKALDHAKARWAASRDPAWLLAALSLANPKEAGAEALVRDAGQVKEGGPAWLSVQHHLFRLTLGDAPPDQTRKRLDAVLARKDLSVSDRNLFRAQRAQVAADLADFMRYALRTRLCADQGGADADPLHCVRWKWSYDFYQQSGVFDREADEGTQGFGEDARAIIDRAPLSTRLAISADPSLPRTLRLDVALTSYARAVGLQDDARIDEAAKQLTTLLPLMATDFRTVAATKPGPDKRFAEFFVLAKIPGVRPDLGGRYVRPEGKRVADFQQRWADWVLAKASVATLPPLAHYQQDGFGVSLGYGDEPPTPDALTDLTCLGDCQRGAAPLRTPEFVASQQATASAERKGYVLFEERYDDKPQPYPAGGVAVWDEMLGWCSAHRTDPRAPEALYWLVRVGRFGGSHNHSGRRAFQLLHARYPQSSWAKQTPYYYD